MKTLVIIGIFVLIPIAVKVVFDQDEELLPSRLQINGKTISVEVAETEQERAIGFSERSSLPANEGLLLVFDEPGEHGVWMKDMKFPVDVLWLDEDYAIVDIAKNISPETYPLVFGPSSSVLYVLEVNAGIADDYNIGTGDKFEFIYDKE